jgi:hypothetical protein
MGWSPEGLAGMPEPLMGVQKTPERCISKAHSVDSPDMNHKVHFA